MDEQALPQLFAPWAQRRGLLLAVSGGPDSMALMHLAAQWAQRSVHPPLFAATVDHGLRAAARQEAVMVASSARALGMPHEVLIWDGEKPKTGIQEKAREARYALLLAHARSVGADVIMTAHHADDQAETILFRLLRGSGLTGLAGMKRETIRDGIAIARPVLDLPKAELVAICRDAGQAFVDDPSNSDSRYARTEMRAVLAALGAHGLDAAGLTRLARRLARADEALALAARSAFASALAKDGAMLDLRALADGPEEIFLRVLTLFLENSGARTPLKLERLEALGAKLRTAVAAGESAAATLAGLQLKLDLRGKLCAAGESPRRRGERPAG